MRTQRGGTERIAGKTDNDTAGGSANMRNERKQLCKAESKQCGWCGRESLNHALKFMQEYLSNA